MVKISDTKDNIKNVEKSKEKDTARDWSTLKRSLLAIFFFMVAIGIGFLVAFLTMPKISLKGDKVMTININGEYRENGVTATYQGRNVSDDVKIIGMVDPSEEGTYEITYSIKKGLLEKKITRTVIVKDIEPPIIMLTGGNELYLCQKGAYEEPGYSAIDNRDGDISQNVQVYKDDNKITYVVTDSEGNKTEAIRNIYYQDNEKPAITLTGGDVTTIALNSTYKELGYKAFDNCDLDLTKDVKVASNVDTKKTGTYEVNYEVTDKAGNKAQVTRKVQVVDKQKGGIIYLTFDDGPKQGTTDVILDILKEEGVLATFFVTNSGPDSLIKRAYDEGHTIALHTASHNYKTVYSSVDAYFADLKKVHDRVERITGLDSRIIRFPGGSSNTVSRNYSKGIMTTLTKEVLERGYHYFDWNITSGDAGETKDPKVIYKNVTKRLSRTRPNVVLMHDVKTYTRDALRDIIHYGKENGYIFEPITMNTTMVHHSVNN